MSEITLTAEQYIKLYALARRSLHTAFVWNDHNFSDPEKMARVTAKEHGITSIDDANDFCGSLPTVPIEG